MSDALLAERNKVIPELEDAGRVLRLADLPAKPGLYALWPVGPSALEDLGLEDVDGLDPLMSRPLYLGKAEDSLVKRVAGKHFVSGDTGHSTVRRTLASLLGLEAVPRRSGIVSPTPKQMLTMTANFDLTRTDDDLLTAWMADNLIVRAAVSYWNPLRGLELEVGAVLMPALDLDRPPMWFPNPWRDFASSARRETQSRLRARLSEKPGG
jgi:hypothetical protein